MEKSVNERVKLLRSFLNLNQQEFGNKINVALATISRIESGISEPRQTTLFAICREFNVSEKWLFDAEGEMFSEGGAKLEKKNGWRDEAYTKLEQYNESLKAEVNFLKSIVNGLLPVQKSFNSGAGVSGFLTQKLTSSVRARA